MARSICIICRELAEKPNENRISKLKVAGGAFLIFLCVIALLVVITFVTPEPMPVGLDVPFSIIKTVAANPIAFSVILIVVFLCLCGSGFTVCKIGEIESSLYDAKGNTIMDKVEGLHQKVDTITSELFSDDIPKNVTIEGLEKAGYNVKVEKKKGGKRGSCSSYCLIF